MTANPKFERYVDAYLTLERKLKWGGPRYREPISPEERARKNALDFYEVDENSMAHQVGCTDWTSSRAVIYAIEAVRALNGGSDGVQDGVELLELALAEAKECLADLNRH